MSKSKRRQLLTTDDAVPAVQQHAAPCSDCPWARTALRGWLGGLDPKTWVEDARSDAVIQCHVLIGAQCAGVAIYRANICKRPRPGSGNITLPANRVTVFATPMEFLNHHKREK